MAVKGIRRFVRFVLDRPSAKKVGEQMEDVLGTAGKEGGENFARELRNAYNRRMAQLREELASGAIDQKRFKEEADKAAKAFNDAMLASIRKAREEGKLTDREYVRLTRSLKRVGDEGKKSATILQTGFRKVASIVAGIFVFRRAQAFFADSIRAYIDQEQAVLRLRGVWEANAGAVQRTFEEVIAFTRQLRDTTLFGQDEIQLATAQLLTYKSVAGDVFERTLRLATDMSAVFGSLTQSTQSLGRALDDPVNGLGMLARAGFTFDESVKRQIRTLVEQNRHLDAQLLLLETLEAEQSGVAQKMRTGWAGAVKGLSDRWGDLKENLGAALVEAERGPSFFEALTEKIQELDRWVVEHKESIGEFASDMLDLATAFLQAAEAAGKFIRAVTSPKKAWDDFWERRRFEKLREGFTPGALTEPERTAPTHNMLGQPIDPATGKPKGPPETPPSSTVPRAPGGVAVQDPFTVDEWGRRRGVGAGLMPGEGAPAMPSTRGGPWEQLRRRQQEQARAAAVIGRQVTGLPGLDPAPVATAAEQAAEAFEGPWLGALDRIANEVESNGDLFRDLGRAWAEGGLAGLAAFAGAKVKENLASAIEWAAKAVGFLAFGRPDQAAAAGKAAAGHAAAATAWKAVSAGLGGSGGGGSRALGAGSGIGTVAAVSGARAEQANPQAPETHIYIDPLDPNRPAVQKTVYAANQYATERFGRDAKVFIHPRTGN